MTDNEVKKLCNQLLHWNSRILSEVDVQLHEWIYENKVTRMIAKDIIKSGNAPKYFEERLTVLLDHTEDEEGFAVEHFFKFPSLIKLDM